MAQSREPESTLRPESMMMSYGYDPTLSEGALKSPIFQTSTFVFRNAEEGKAFFELAYGLRPPKPGEKPGLIYSRLNNPDLEILEDRLTLFDAAEDAAVFASGMAAISASIFAFARPGDVILHSSPLYGGTEHLLAKILPEFGITSVGFRAGAGPAAMAAAMQKCKGRRLALILIETPANPTNDLVDIAACATLAKQNGNVPLVVDNTFLGPLWQKPLAHGASLVVYSATKFLGGHSDLIAGAIVGPRDLVERVRGYRTFLGTMPDAWTSWLLLRSLETLKLRMTSAMKNARYVADFLVEQPKVEAVHYLGHLKAGDPQHAIYQRQCTAPGSMISFEVKGGQPAAFRCLNALRLAKLAVSLGGTESLAQHPASMTHADVPPETQKEFGITPGMVRLSVGIEHPEDQIADLQQALAKV